MHLYQIIMGGFRSQPEIKKETVLKQCAAFNYAVSAMCGWRQYMEDAHLCTVLSDKKSYLFAVFDGHGGAQVSTFVERHFIQQLEKNKHFKNKNYQLALRQTFLKMDQLLLSNQGKKQVEKIQNEMKNSQNGPNYQQDSHAGCTANVCLITPDFIYVANAGDSRAVCCTTKGETKQLSKDHKPEEKVEIDRITKAGGQVTGGRVNGNLNLSRAIGDLQYKSNKKISPQQQIITANPDITKIKNQNIDFIIMGCDGIWQVKTNSQMVNYIRKKLDEKKPLNKIVEDLLDELLSKDTNSQYGMDNMSAILIKFNNKK